MSKTEPDKFETLAAIDLGSNSFHMVIARHVNGQVQVIDRLRENVRLGSGLDENDCITTKTRLRALNCLQQFAQRLRHIPSENIRIVGTKTLRRAQNSAEFCSAAADILGRPVEVISGREEARLIYSGVERTHPLPGEKRLVVDIGGGSTELIVGVDSQPELLESVDLGVVTLTEQCFKDGRAGKSAVAAAQSTVESELLPYSRQFRRAGWQCVEGSSGTARTIAAMLAELRICFDGITADGLQQLLERLIKAGDVSTLKFDCVSRKRKSVIVAGVVILSGIFHSLRIEKMSVARGALREGVLHTLIESERRHSVREQTVGDLQSRLSVDREHAERVRATADLLFDQVVVDWQLDELLDRELLSMAADLHEIGLAVSHAQFHKHGAYLLANADLFGFSRSEQACLAAMVRCHRRKLAEDVFSQLGDRHSKRILRLTLLLRLAALLQRDRIAHGELPISLRVSKYRLNVTLPKAWMQKHPLTRAQLESEAAYLAKIGYEMLLNTDQ